MQNLLRIPLRRSRLLALLLLAAHGLALIVVWVSALPIMLHVALKLLVLASLLYALDQFGWLRPARAPTLLRILPAEKEDVADVVHIAFADGRLVKGFILPGSLVLPICIVLPFRREDGPAWRARGQLVLLPDTADHEDLRALRVRLRWGRHAPV